MEREQSDDSLMAAVARGEEAAFGLLVRRWEYQVRSFLVHMLGSVEEAEDLTQDTFVKVFDRSGAYRAEGMFKSWLLKIAGNLARSRLRRRKVIGWLPFDARRHDRPTTGPDPQQVLENDQLGRVLEAALKSLPPRQKEALVLHRFQALKYREIAEVMDTSLAGVESLIQRALENLRGKLKQQGVEP